MNRRATTRAITLNIRTPSSGIEGYPGNLTGDIPPIETSPPDFMAFRLTLTHISYPNYDSALGQRQRGNIFSFLLGTTGDANDERDYGDYRFREYRV